MDIKRLDENYNVRQEFYKYAVECCINGIEIWVDIEGYEGLYQISNMGRVKTISRYKSVLNPIKLLPEKIMKYHICKGYYMIALTKNKKETHKKAHRLVGIHFIPNPENKPEINHKNGIKSLNSVIDIEWNTSSENKIHGVRIGLYKPNKGCFNNGYASLRKKKIKQYSKGGELIKEYDSLTMASNETGWKHKKKSRSKNIDWKSTLTNAISLNKVYKQNGQTFNNNSKGKLSGTHKAAEDFAREIEEKN